MMTINKISKVGFLIIISLITTMFSTLSFSKVIHSERSLYRNIIVEDKKDLRCLKFNVRSSKTNQSCMLKNAPNKLVFNYTKLVFSSLLMIDSMGMGGWQLLTYAFNYC